MVDSNPQLLTISKVNSLLSSVLDDTSKCSEIVHELGKKIKYITLTLDAFSDILGEDGKIYKIKTLNYSEI